VDPIVNDTLQNDVPLEDDEYDRSLLRVYRAIYSYNPVECSPNEQPDSELVLCAGDYVFVCGDMDEVLSNYVYVD